MTTLIVDPDDPIARTMAMMDRLETVMDDPEVMGLIAVLASEGISDAYAESIRAQLREITYQARLVLGEAA